MCVDQYVVKTPGCLQLRFGHESHTNMFHGGTIICDAALKYIHSENQVSLGAGKTVNSKLKFEYWLREKDQLLSKH